jgi:hypothetical protein
MNLENVNVVHFQSLKARFNCFEYVFSAETSFHDVVPSGSVGANGLDPLLMGIFGQRKEALCQNDELLSRNIIFSDRLGN